MTWVLLTWFCTAAGCTPLPDLGPMTSDFCRRARPGFVQMTPRPGAWIEARCAPLPEKD